MTFSVLCSDGEKAQRRVIGDHFSGNAEFSTITFNGDAFSNYSSPLQQWHAKLLRGYPKTKTSPLPSPNSASVTYMPTRRNVLQDFEFKGGGRRELRTLAVNKNKLWNLTLGCPEKRWRQEEETFKTLVDSFLPRL